MQQITQWLPENEINNSFIKSVYEHLEANPRRKPRIAEKIDCKNRHCLCVIDDAIETKRNWDIVYIDTGESIHAAYKEDQA